MAKRIPVIAIIGRTNVGKSTLFNQIAGRPIQIVENTHGVTRDRSYIFVKRFSFPFTLIDTGGIVGEENLELATSIRRQAELAVSEADVVFAVFDGLDGLHPLDEEVVHFLRRAGKPVVWIVNKCEKPDTAAKAHELYALGLEDVLFISAAHNRGTKDVVKKAQELLGTPDFTVDPEDTNTIKVAIVGRPNTGKSTLLNRLTGDQRSVTSPLAGTTRDLVNVKITRDGQDYEIVDTAGLRKKARVDDQSIEELSNFQTVRAISESDVCVLLIDATEGPPSEQDSKIAGLIHERGKGFIIVVNKWDIMEKDHKTSQKFKEALYQELKFASYAPVVFVSALTGRRCPNILETAKKVQEDSRVRIKTNELNKVFERAFSTNPPPVYRGEPVKLFFAVQAGVCPPSFVLFLNHPRRINFSYERYLKNSVRKEYPYQGVDIRIMFRKKRSSKDQSGEDNE